jgi:hypothetical protein
VLGGVLLLLLLDLVSEGIDMGLGEEDEVFDRVPELEWCL